MSDGNLRLFAHVAWPFNVVEIEGKRIDPRDVQFSLLDSGKIAGLYLFIPGYRDGDVDLKQIGYLLLDEALDRTAPGAS